MHTLTEAKQLIKICLETASERFDIDLSSTIIDFSLRGRCTGRASRKNGQCKVRFNQEAMALDWNVFINTISHEIAHLVCYLRPELGRNHNNGWKRVHRILGGTGKRCHTMNLTPARRTKKYQYITTTGKEVEISSVIHGKIQKRGQTRTYHNRLYGQIGPQSEWKRVA